MLLEHNVLSLQHILVFFDTAHCVLVFCLLSDARRNHRNPHSQEVMPHTGSGSHRDSLIANSWKNEKYEEITWLKKLIIAQKIHYNIFCILGKFQAQ